MSDPSRLEGDPKHVERFLTAQLSETSKQISKPKVVCKPNFSAGLPPPSILSAVSAFIPQIKASNAILEEKIAAGEMVDIGIGIQAIDATNDADEDMEGEKGDGIEMEVMAGVMEEVKPVTADNIIVDKEK
ncbi:protein of unknown function DUF4598 [Kipferlia bialata]|uniref:Uncharacterized protein n=1 Tax=Kipferlia bialata TaxID=797122 RepID=A0A9K3DCR4_9EUKA|nr:protein of unknown function DUF4598 [Kipferlia bialata]|eukprot:g14792.t1